MILRTERLFIRPFEKGDENDLYEIYSDVKVCQYLLHDICNEDNKSKEFQKKLQNNSLKTDAKLNLACVLDEKVIGDISVFYTGMKETVEIGFVFNREYSKKDMLMNLLDQLWNIYLKMLRFIEYKLI